MDCSRESRAIVAARARVLLGHDVGGGPNHWAPPGSDKGRGTALSAAAARREGARGLLGCAERAGSWRWAVARKKGGRGRKTGRAGGEEEEEWAEPESGEGERKHLFLFIFPSFAQIF